MDEHLRNNQRKKDKQIIILGNMLDIKRKIVFKSCTFILYKILYFYDLCSLNTIF